MKYLLCLFLLVSVTSCTHEDGPIVPKEAIITLIDDDTLTPGSVETFHQVCVDNDIVGTYACITSRGIFYSSLFPMLREYESEGFQVALHCHEQKNFYCWTQNMDMTVSGIHHISIGDVYTYMTVDGPCPLTVEELHLDAEGNGHIYFHYMQEHFPTPKTLVGKLERSSGTGDVSIAYSGYQVLEFRDNEKISADMDTAIEIFKNEGFENWNYFVAPYGAQDSGLQAIVRKHGMKCLVSISNDDYMRYDSQYTPYNIPRIGFNAVDAGVNTMGRLKQHIDAVSVTGGWLLVGTHIYNGWTDELLRTRFKEFVDYAKMKGLKFKTLKQGYEQYYMKTGDSH